MTLHRTPVLAFLLAVLATVPAQARGYADADNPSQAVGMMKMTILMSGIMEKKCVARFPEQQGQIQADLKRWRALDSAEIETAERSWRQMEQKKPGMSRDLEEAAKQGYESQLAAPARLLGKAAETKIHRDYCAQYFNELATGVWRKQTPLVYQYLANAPK